MNVNPANFAFFIPRFKEREIQFILIGGGAAIAHGSATTTYDVDFVYARNRANMERIAAALTDVNPYLRGVPEGLPFRWDLSTLESGLNFTLTTTQGDIDLLGDVPGGPDYEALEGQCELIELFGHEVNVVTLPTLIRLKKAAGRPKDLVAIAELNKLLTP